MLCSGSHGRLKIVKQSGEMKENSALALEVQEQIYLNTVGTILAEVVLRNISFGSGSCRVLKERESFVKPVSEKTRLGKEEHAR